MKKLKKLGIFSSLSLLLILLSGCVQTYKSGPHAGEPTGDGIIYKFLVEPMSYIVKFFANDLHWGYGLGIIAITIIVRLLILPLGLNSSKKMLIQQQKMTMIQPEMQKIQKLMLEAKTPEEKMQLNLAMQTLMKENNISMFGGMGCLPLIIQMPFFTSLFYAARYTPGINQAEFLGINLGSPNFILTVLAFGSYVLQGYLSSLSMPKEQRKQMQMTMLVSPLMIFFMSINSPAGVTLYWVIGGIISCLQVLITNFYHRPRIIRQIEAEFKDNPPTVTINIDDFVPKEVKEAHPVTPREDDLLNNINHQKSSNKKQRNAGKQHRHK